MVYGDTGDFLVTAYIHIAGGGCTLAYPLGFIRFTYRKIMGYPLLPLGYLMVYDLFLGGYGDFSLASATLVTT